MSADGETGLNHTFTPDAIARVHEMADTGQYPIRGLGAKRKLPTFDDLVFLSERGISPEFMATLRRLRYRSLPIGDAVKDAQGLVADRDVLGELDNRPLFGRRLEFRLLRRYSFNHACEFVARCMQAIYRELALGVVHRTGSFHLVILP